MLMSLYLHFMAKPTVDAWKFLVPNAPMGCQVNRATFLNEADRLFGAELISGDLGWPSPDPYLFRTNHDIGNAANCGQNRCQALTGQNIMQETEASP